MKKIFLLFLALLLLVPFSSAYSSYYIFEKAAWDQGDHNFTVFTPDTVGVPLSDGNLTVTGERDWDTSKTYPDDYNANLRAYLKMNNYLLDPIGFPLNAIEDETSYNSDGNLFHGATLSPVGLWDTNALVLDGVNDHASILHDWPLELEDAFTAEMRIKLDENFSVNSDYHQGLFDKGSFQAFFDRTTGKLKFVIDKDVDSLAALSFNTGEHTVFSLTNYDGNLYAGTGSSVAPANGYIFTFDGTTWSLSYDSASNHIYSMIAYDSNLYAGADDKLYTYDGTTWSESHTFPGSEGIISLSIYDGNLWAGTDANGYIYTFDGTNWTLDYNSTETGINSLVVYDGNLWAGTNSNGLIYAYDGSTWSLSYDSPDTTINSLAVYDDNLFAGADDAIYTYDRNTWSESLDTNQTSIRTASYNGRLYAGSGPDGYLYYYDYDSGWIQYYDTPTSGFPSLADYDKNMYYGANLPGIIQTYGKNETLDSNRTEWIEDTWYHLAFVCGSSTPGGNKLMRIYVDGILNASYDTGKDFNIESTDYELYLGSAHGSKFEGDSAGLFDGVIEEVTIEETFKTQSQIEADYNAWLIGPSYVSELFDGVQTSEWLHFIWTETNEVGADVNFQVKSCDEQVACEGQAFVGPNGDTNTYFTSGNTLNDLNSTITPNSRYFQFSVTFDFNLTNFPRVSDFNVEYRDAQDPVISNIKLEDISPTGATITWNTDEDANSEVEYGLTDSYGDLVSSGTLTQVHSLTLSDLNAYSTYHYRVESCDEAGNCVASSDRTFYTDYSVSNVSPSGDKIWNDQLISVLFGFTDFDNNAMYPNIVDCNAYYSVDINYEIALANGTLNFMGAADWDLNEFGNCDTNGDVNSINASCAYAGFIPESVRDETHYFIVRCNSNNNLGTNASEQSNRIVKNLQTEWNYVLGGLPLFLLLMFAVLGLIIVPSNEVRIAGVILIIGIFFFILLSLI